MAPRAILMKSGLTTVNTARPVNAAHPKSTKNAAKSKTYFSKSAHSTVKMPFHKKTTFTNSNVNQRVNTVRSKTVNTARLKAVVNAILGNRVNGNPQMDLQDKKVIDSRCSRHMTRNMSYLTDYKEIDGGYVAFGGNPKGGKITGKCIIRTASVKRLMKKMYCLVIIDDYSRFTWVFFLASKDETSVILKTFITGIENLVDHKDTVRRCDNRTEFKNREMNQFCEMKCIMRQYSVARTSQKNRVAERRNMTLIKAARTMLADLKLPNTFWAEEVNTAWYVQNKVLVVKHHNKTPYELFHSRTPALSFMRPFGCPVTIFNTKDHLGNFDGKADEGFFVGYSLNSKAFRVLNSRTRIVEENLHIRFRENTPNVIGTQFNDFAGTKANDNAGQARKEKTLIKDYILLPLWTDDPPFSQDSKNQEKEDNVDNSNIVNAAGTNGDNVFSANTNNELITDLEMPALEDISIFNFSSDHEYDDEMANMNKLDSTIQVSPFPTKRIHKDQPLDQVIRDLHSTTQTRNMSKNLEEHGNKNDKRGIVIRNKARLVTQGHTQEEGINYDEVFAPIAKIKAIRLFLAYASFKDFVVYQMNVKNAFLYGKIEEEVYVCQSPGFEDPDFPDKVYKVKKALYGLHQAPRAWYETLSTYLLDNGFYRGKIDNTLFIRRPKGDILLVQVYVDDIIFGSTRKELCIAFEKMMHEKFQMSSIRELTFFLGLQVKQNQDRIFISQDKYVAEILKKYRFTEGKNTSTPMETQKPLLKDED
nr:retrovirus-related Pol polyprotein from transposon TNT 1-94 [Tanacetum cinerariifolium]